MIKKFAHNGYTKIVRKKIVISHIFQNTCKNILKYIFNKCFRSGEMCNSNQPLSCRSFEKRIENYKYKKEKYDKILTM